MSRATSEKLSWDLDFDEGVYLARTDPDGFERRRRAVIDDFIDNAPERHRQRLRGLQWRIDMERRRAPNPMAACVRISQMMWESFAGEGGLADTLQHGPSARGRAGRVLQFPGRART